MKSRLNVTFHTKARTQDVQLLKNPFTSWIFFRYSHKKFWSCKNGLSISCHRPILQYR